MSRNTAARVIVCEPSPRWAVLLRRFTPELQISEARSLTLADDMLREAPACVVAVDFTDANAAQGLLRLAQWQCNHPTCVTAALLDHPDDDFALALRESGAQLVLHSLFELPQLARLARKLHEQSAA